MFIAKHMRPQRLFNSKKLNFSFNKIDSIRLPMATEILLNRMLYHKPTHNGYFLRAFSTSPENESLESIKFEKVCEETLQSLTEYFEELVENAPHLKEADVSYSSGVLTVSFGAPYGTYVINRQSPNRQIWLSSPTSGPKRYDFVMEGGYWLYKHDGKTLHKLLQEEIPKITNSDVDFTRCSYGKL